MPRTPARAPTRTVPIVFPVAGDPVATGIVDSLARPGGNVTGFIEFEFSMGGKWLELLKQIAPGVTRVAVLRDPTQGSGTSQFAAIQAVAPSLRVEVNPVNMRDAPEIERAIAAFAHSPNGGLIVTAGSATVLHSNLIVMLAAGHKLPAVYNQVRACDQPEDRQGARPRRATGAARPRRRGDRVRRTMLIATRRGALAAAIGLLVCCSAGTRSARAIECLTSPNQSERGWWSWREIDGRKCWYKKVGPVPPKSEFVWPEAPPGEERDEQEPTFMRATEPMASPSPEVEMARVKPVDPTVDFRLSEGLIDLTKGFSLAGFHGIGGALETPTYTPVSRDTFDERFGQW